MHRDDFSIVVQDIVINGSILMPPAGKAGIKSVVVLCHGIPGGTSSDASSPGYAYLAEELAAEGHCVAFFNFRGAGDSGGDFDIRGWMDDLGGVISYIRARFAPPPILFGFSAGGAVAVCVAKNDPAIGGLILCGSPAAFTRVLVDQGPEQFLEHARTIGIIRHPDFPADRHAWANGFRAVCAEKNIGACGTIPKLIIHGDDDDTVPVDHAYRLYAAAAEPKELVIIKGGGHRLRLNEDAMSSARKWLKRMSSKQ